MMSKEKAQKIVEVRRTQMYGHYNYSDEEYHEALKVLKE